MRRSERFLTDGRDCLNGSCEENGKKMFCYHSGGVRHDSTNHNALGKSRFPRYMW